MVGGLACRCKRASRQGKHLLRPVRQRIDLGRDPAWRMRHDSIVILAGCADTRGGDDNAVQRETQGVNLGEGSTEWSRAGGESGEEQSGSFTQRKSRPQSNGGYQWWFRVRLPAGAIYWLSCAQVSEGICFKITADFESISSGGWNRQGELAVWTRQRGKTPETYFCLGD
jgi:hypothetical protein